jgi:hypothetical protein
VIAGKRLASTVAVAMASWIVAPAVAVADAGDCLQPKSAGAGAIVSDCLFVLQARSVGGSRECRASCICDADGDDDIDTLDALVCLRKAVGLDTLPLCGACEQPLPALLVVTRGIADNLHEWRCPPEFSFSVFLAAEGRGWVSFGTPSTGSRVSEVEWQETEAGILIRAHAFRIADSPWPELHWEVGWRDLVIDVVDDDGDGIAESGNASVTIECEYEELTLIGEVEIDLTMSLAPDDAAPILGLARNHLHPLFGGPIVMGATRPLLRASLEHGVALLVDGSPLGVAVTPSRAQGPFALGASLNPGVLLPFGVNVTLAAENVTDVLGRAATVFGAGFRTVDNPGPLTNNAGFEGDGAWIGLDSTTEPFPFSHVEGQRHARVRSLSAGGSGEMLGYLDVPQDATTLRFWAGVEDYIGLCGAGARVDLITPAGIDRLFPRPGVRTEPCGCTSGERIPWTAIVADLRPQRGRRIVIRATPGEFAVCLPDVYEELALDDFRVD